MSFIDSIKNFFKEVSSIREDVKKEREQIIELRDIIKSLKTEMAKDKETIHNLNKKYDDLYEKMLQHKDKWE